MKTPTQIASDTLADHAIQPHFRRSGDQVAKLIEEAIEADREQHALEEYVQVDSPHIQGILDRWNDASEGSSADAEHEAAQEMADMLETIHAKTVKE